MKKTSSCLIALLVYLSSCNLKHKDTFNSYSGDSVVISTKKIDSLKWFFYAYTYESDLLFKSSTGSISLKPVQCDVAVINLKQYAEDSIFVKLAATKDSLQFLKIYNGLPVEGFISYKGLTKPLIAHIIIKNFQDSIQLKNDNYLTNKGFENYLKEIDTLDMSNWLKEEARKRKVIP